MERTRHNILLKLARMFSMVLMTFCFTAGSYLYHGKNVAFPSYKKGKYMIILMCLILFIVFAKIHDPFDALTNRISKMAYSQSLAILASYAVMFIVVWLLTRDFSHAVPMLVLFAAQCITAPAWVHYAHHWYCRTFQPRTTAMIYQNRIGIQKLIGEYGLDKKFDDRITPIDKVIRKGKLDELPQLFNILFDTMRLVGTQFITGTTEKTLINQGLSAA